MDVPVGADDAALVRAVAVGSEDALATLYDRHAGSIYGAALRLVGDRHLAEDIVQETFLIVWNRAESFDPAVGSLGAWIHTIARNRAVDRLRAVTRRPRLVSAMTISPDARSEVEAIERLAATSTAGRDGVPPIEPGPEPAILAGEVMASLRAALATMPETERTVIVLAYRDELSQSEIATRLGWPLGTVKTRTRRALLRLRAILAAADPDEHGRIAVAARVEVGE